jgi:YD repeat-containing protein
VIAKIDALHNREEFQYDKDSNLKYHKDVAGAETRFTYEFNRIKTVTDGLAKTTEFFYDAVGNMERKVAPNGAETKYLYNNVNRMETMIVKDKNEQGQDITLVTEFKYDGYGNLIWTKDPKGGITEIHYDERNLPVQVKDASGAITTYAYDHVGRLRRSKSRFTT